MLFSMEIKIFPVSSSFIEYELNTKPVTLSGSPGHDAKPYQERQVQAAIEESKK